MNTPNTQTEQPTPTLKPDFKHRIAYRVDELTPATPYGLFEAISMIIDRATGVLNVVQNEFSADADRERISDTAIFYSLESIEKDLLDVRSLAKEFLEKNRINSDNVEAKQ